MKSIITCCILTAYLVAGPISPGHQSLDLSRASLKNERGDTLAVSLSQNGQTSFAGFIVLSTWMDGETLSRKERLIASDGREVEVDSFTLDPRTLAPIYRVVSGSVITNPGNTFYPNSLDIVLAALPLEEGYTAELALDNEGTELSSIASINVTGIEEVDLLDGESCLSWVVEVFTGERIGIYFIDHKNRRLNRYFDPSEGLITTRLRNCDVDL